MALNGKINECFIQNTSVLNENQGLYFFIQKIHGDMKVGLFYSKHVFLHEKFAVAFFIQKRSFE